MATRRSTAQPASSTLPHSALPVVCVVTSDEDFLEELVPELIPWFQVVLREDYSDLARWSREAHVASVLLDIDTDDAGDGHGGLAVLNELRKLNQNFVIISLSRSRTRERREPGCDVRSRGQRDRRRRPRRP